MSDSFATLARSFDGETDAFIEEVARSTDGSLGTLLSADFTLADPKLTGFYGLPATGSTGFARVALGVVLLNSPDAGRQAVKLLDRGFAAMRRPLGAQLG